MSNLDEEEVRVVPESDKFAPYQVVIPWESLAERFEEWVTSQGWSLSPRLLFGTETDEIPSRFVQPPLPTTPTLPTVGEKR